MYLHPHPNVYNQHACFERDNVIMWLKYILHVIEAQCKVFIFVFQWLSGEGHVIPVQEPTHTQTDTERGREGDMHTGKVIYACEYSQLY